MPGVNQVDPLPCRVQELVVAEIGSNKGVASGGNGRIRIVPAGAAAHRHLADRPPGGGVPDAAAAKATAHKADKLPQIPGFRQQAAAADFIVGKWPRILQTQGFRQGIVDTAFRGVQIGVHTDGGNPVPQEA